LIFKIGIVSFGYMIINKNKTHCRAKTLKSDLSPVMTVLDTISRYRATESVFKSWDDRAGECICCNALFDTVEQVSIRYGLNLNVLMAELDLAATKDHF
jgi:hypothetical protein